MCLLSVSCSDSGTSSTNTQEAEPSVSQPAEATEVATATPPAGDIEATTIGAVVAEVFSAHSTALAKVSDIDQQPISPDFALVQSRRALDALDPMLEALPADVSGLSGDGAEEYAQLRGDLVGWRDYSLGVIDEVEADYDELLALAEEWDRNSAPPMALTEPIDGHLITWIPTVEQSCVAFALAADVTPGCLIASSGVSEPAEEAEPQTLTMGSTTVEIDPTFPVTDLGVEPGFAFFDYGPGIGTLTVLEPPPAADPTSVGPALGEVIAWPDDVDAWLADLPVEVVSARDEDLGATSWRIWHIRADERVAIAENIRHPEGAWVVGEGELHIHQTVIGDDRILAVFEVAPPDIETTAQSLDDISAVLSTISVL